jgi:hypothetical protein
MRVSLIELKTQKKNINDAEKRMKKQATGLTVNHLLNGFRRGPPGLIFISYFLKGFVFTQHYVVRFFVSLLVFSKCVRGVVCFLDCSLLLLLVAARCCLLRLLLSNDSAMQRAACECAPDIHVPLH